ncbi:MAG: FKBP-type peptidyl-prolyl cis-trans isomerase [Sphaerochaetaceae bacterium]|jgi:FKBP-type peptidyl-prolyl cis-trans isomerase FklB
MKKILFVAGIIVASIFIISCAGTKTDDVVSSDAFVSTTGDFSTEVISRVPSFNPTDDDLEYTFSYVYGYLLTQNILSEELDLEVEPFIRGSADFYDFVEPLLDSDDINEMFGYYQDYLDGEVAKEDLDSLSGEVVGPLSSFIDKFSYGYGYIIQYNLQVQGLFVDLSGFNAGVSDAFSNIPLTFSDEEIDELFMAYQQMLESEYHEMFAQIAEENLVEAEEFLATNSEKEGVITTSSGLQYIVEREGDGASPTSSSDVEVDYMITFLDGTTGDNSYARGEPAVFNLESLISGFSEGVQLMKEGSHYRFFLHPALAYGEMGFDFIEPNSLLIFDIELHKVLD